MAVNYNRKMIKLTLHSLYEGTADEVIEQIQGLKQQYGPTLRFDYEEGRYDDRQYFYAFYERPETDEEMASRIEKEERLAENAAAYERQQYEALKAKYG